MDGGRGVLRSLGDQWSPAPARPSYAAPAPAAPRGVVHPFPAPVRPEAPRFSPAPKAPARRSRRARRWDRLAVFGRLARKRGFGLFLMVAFLGTVGGAGAVRGGQYERFVAEFGTLQDLGARLVGFSIEGVTIVGAKELSEDEILAATNITTRDSLPFVDVASVRARIKEIPMVRDVSVRKLYPSRLLVEVQERSPYALWQVNGNVQVISADGMAIDQLADERQARLPFVVGEDANLHVPEFLKILASAGELRDQVRAGVLVSGRRWNLKLMSGLEVKLPEHAPEAAFANFAKLSREMRILDKDLISVDLRIPDRMVARLTADAAAARADALAKKPRKGGQT
ncbi:MAG: cell division protein FtsQ [Hyphomicrobiales bacterium]|nr:cell division protein FtsQ [Hyphomicrobiales bacterium]